MENNSSPAAQNADSAIRAKRTLPDFFNAQRIVASILIVFFIACPAVIVAMKPTSYNELSQVLFGVLLSIVSIWFGAINSNEKANKIAMEKWLPAAESASKALLAMGTTVDRMRRKQGEACKALEPVLSGIPTEQLVPVTTALKIRCDACREGLSYLKFHIDNSFSDWDAFIEVNCDEGVCTEIHKRLDDKRTELADAIKKDFPEAAPSG